MVHMEIGGLDMGAIYRHTPSVNPAVTSLRNDAVM
jgi:hypothetical protein